MGWGWGETSGQSFKAAGTPGLEQTGSCGHSFLTQVERASEKGIHSLLISKCRASRAVWGFP